MTNAYSFRHRCVVSSRALGRRELSCEERALRVSHGRRLPPTPPTRWSRLALEAASYLFMHLEAEAPATARTRLQLIGRARTATATTERARAPSLTSLSGGKSCADRRSRCISLALVLLKSVLVDHRRPAPLGNPGTHSPAGLTQEDRKPAQKRPTQKSQLQAVRAYRGSWLAVRSAATPSSSAGPSSVVLASAQCADPSGARRHMLAAARSP
ncbi:hypothetical protein PHLGIDRAFT_240335 [Phlebiopsis gigantea 11061_1 CR5-6]|uniref:Uncharacterized protein n=1 Tax=Phlebiopsis gigantea (strain 11061_1 CR5-6) TaxID=745531 RepID=A0A0C3SBW5_PHLG1|nr:hypothetical protein PHLGIDRAFT_240335 [Phlebiopsis gigantea 11061_1 CR5-6]